MKSICCFLILLTTIVGSPMVLAQSEESPDWNQWRGPSRDGEFRGAKLPEKLDDSNLTQLWRIEMGPSYSGPLVTEDRVFVTETKDKTYEVVTAIDRKSGEIAWQSQWEGSMTVPFFASENGSWIRSTPAYDDGKIYVGGIRDVVVCLNAEDGKTVWSIDFPKTTGSKNPDFGFSSSPMIHGDAVYVQVGGAFYKLNKQDGSVIWKAMDDGGGMLGSAFSSPFVATIDDVQQILVQTRTTLAGVDMESGKTIWSQDVPSFRGMNILTPLVFDNAVFTSSYRNFSWLFRPSKNDQTWTVSKEWETKKPAYMSTPVSKDNLLFMHLQNQRFTCLDLKTGQTKWTSQPYGKYSSMIVQGDKVLALDQGGELVMFRATGDQFELLSEHRVSNQETWAHLAARDNQLFVRELNAIAGYEFEPGK